ncbi:hypothetical protein [Pseudonocardia yuanmonensis]|uniref:hypothetical protein n=1 Tax=Pseudonocardia yuanmonensis TaxID=1095914 RepID=UPI0031E75E16
MERDVRELDDRIATMIRDAAEPGGTVTGQLEELNAQRLALTSQIADLAQQAEIARLGVPRVAAGTIVIDPARVVTDALTTAAIMNVAVGLVLGLGLGLAVAAVLTVTQDRPVLRSDIAAQLGSSVILQTTGRARVSRVRRWVSRRADRERRRAVATLARLIRHSPGQVSLIEIGCPRVVASLALDLAGELAVDRPVTVVDDLPGGVIRSAGKDPEPGVRVVQLAERAVAEASSLDGGCEVRIGVGSARPGATWMNCRRLGADALLVVRAGHASALELHTVARHLERSGVSRLGIVLVDPDPRDRTDGTLWGDLHRLLDDRVDLPTQADAAPPGAATQNGARRVELT